MDADRRGRDDLHDRRRRRPLLALRESAAAPRKHRRLDARRDRRHLRAAPFALSAVARDTILDDVLTPMRAVLAGYRVVFDEQAMAFDRAAADADAEQPPQGAHAGGQLPDPRAEPRLLLPWSSTRSGCSTSRTSSAGCSCPYALFGLFAASVALAGRHLFYRSPLIAQCALYPAWRRTAPGWTFARGGAAHRRRTTVRTRRQPVAGGMDSPWPDDTTFPGTRLVDRLARIAFMFLVMNYSAVVGLVSALRKRKVWRHDDDHVERALGVQLRTPASSRAGNSPGDGGRPDAAVSRRSRTPSRRDWGYLGLLAFTAVLLLRPQDQIPGLASLHLAEICALHRHRPDGAAPLRAALPLFRVTPKRSGCLLRRSRFSRRRRSRSGPAAPSRCSSTYLKIVIVFILMMNTLTTPRRVEQLTWLILLCCGYIAFRAVFDYARGVNLVEGGRVGGAVSGIFGNPNDLALNMVTFMPAALMVVA